MPNWASGHQKQPSAKVAVSVRAGAAASIAGIADAFIIRAGSRPGSPHPGRASSRKAVVLSLTPPVYAPGPWKARPSAFHQKGDAEDARAGEEHQQASPAFLQVQEAVSDRDDR